MEREGTTITVTPSGGFEPFPEFRRSLTAQAEPTLHRVGELRPADADLTGHVLLLQELRLLGGPHGPNDLKGHDPPCVRVDDRLCDPAEERCVFQEVGVPKAPPFR